MTISININCHHVVKSLSRVQLFVIPWTVAYQVPPSMGFSRQEYWSGLPFPYPQNTRNIHAKKKKKPKYRHIKQSYRHTNIHRHTHEHKNKDWNTEPCAVLSFVSHVQLFVTLWIVAYQASLSMEILQARILEWVAMSSSRGSFPPRDCTRVSCSFFSCRHILYHWATREAINHRTT